MPNNILLTSIFQSAKYLALHLKKLFYNWNDEIYIKIKYRKISDYIQLKQN